MSSVNILIKNRLFWHFPLATVLYFVTSFGCRLCYKREGWFFTIVASSDVMLIWNICVQEKIEEESKSNLTVRLRWVTEANKRSFSGFRHQLRSLWVTRVTHTCIQWRHLKKDSKELLDWASYRSTFPLPRGKLQKRTWPSLTSPHVERSIFYVIHAH